MTPPTQDELHALVDAQLDPQRSAEVLAWLRQHPESTWTLLNWQLQASQLRRLARDTAAQAPDPAFAPRRAPAEAPRRGAGRFRPAWARVWTWGPAGAAVLVAALAWQWGRAPQLAPPPDFVQRAGLAHAVFVPERRHPVEVGAEEQAHLVQWLGKRLGRPLSAPDLQAQGYRLMGGRLLPDSARAPGAQFMYEGPQGQRMTLYVSVDPGSTRPVAFQRHRDGDREALYWIDGALGYALLAEGGAPLTELAQAVHAQLNA